jgi:hypothetical protein
VNPMAGRPRRFRAFFPSLSRAIGWKPGAVSRVRCAAQKPGALDTAPAFQNKSLLRRKRREEGARLKAATLESGGFNRRHNTQTQRPRPALAYCRQKMVLTMGSTLAGGPATPILDGRLLNLMESVYDFIPFAECALVTGGLDASWTPEWGVWALASVTL